MKKKQKNLYLSEELTELLEEESNQARIAEQVLREYYGLEQLPPEEFR